MGLIKAIAGAAGGALADSWREYFYCEALNVNLLAVKGCKRTSSRRSSNTKGEDNIISNGAVIAVADGQCMLIVQQGQVVEVCATPGEFVWDSSTEPSIFYGSLGEGVKATFAQIGRRFGFGGDTGKDQRVYYINTKEIMGNKYGTPAPVPFRVIDNNIGLDMDIAIRCFGEYSYRICDPLLFYVNVCGNIEAAYNRASIDSQLKSELMTALQPALARVSAQGVRYSALPGHAAALAEALNSELSAKWSQLRGVCVASLGVSSVKASEEDEARIKDLQQAAVLRDPGMAAATLAGAQAQAMRDAAKNTGGMGAMGAFMGMNMAGAAGGMNVGQLFEISQAQQQAAAPAPPAPAAAPTAAAAAGMWTCSCGAADNQGNFCHVCGAKKPQPQGWNCSCGAINQGKFCPECGAKKPAGAPLYRCDKCGWQPQDPTHPPKFCPECGDCFDESDTLK